MIDVKVFSVNDSALALVNKVRLWQDYFLLEDVSFSNKHQLIISMFVFCPSVNFSLLPVDSGPYGRSTHTHVGEPSGTTGSMAMVFFFFFHSHYSFFKFIFSWRIIALHYCVGFWHTSVWVSHRNTHVPCLLNLPPTLLVCHRAPGWAPLFAP